MWVQFLYREPSFRQAGTRIIFLSFMTEATPKRHSCIRGDPKEKQQNSNDKYNR